MVGGFPPQNMQHVECVRPFSLSLFLSFFLQGLGVVQATLRPSARPAQPPRCVRKRLALGFLLTEALYHKMGSVFSCSKPQPFTLGTPRIPAIIPYGYHSVYDQLPGACFWKHKKTVTVVPPKTGRVVLPNCCPNDNVPLSVEFPSPVHFTRRRGIAN